jgi:hypothetical protein
MSLSKSTLFQDACPKYALNISNCFFITSSATISLKAKSPCSHSLVCIYSSACVCNRALWHVDCNYQPFINTLSIPYLLPFPPQYIKITNINCQQINILYNFKVIFKRKAYQKVFKICRKKVRHLSNFCLHERRNLRASICCIFCVFFYITAIFSIVNSSPSHLSSF